MAPRLTDDFGDDFDLFVFDVHDSYREESLEEKIVRIIKSDFEKNFGIGYAEFEREYKKMLKTNPEKFI